MKPHADSVQQPSDEQMDAVMRVCVNIADRYAFVGDAAFPREREKLRAVLARLRPAAEPGEAQNPKFTMAEWTAHARKHRWRFDIDTPADGVAAEPSQSGSAGEAYPPMPEAPIIGTSRFGSIFRGHSDDAMRAYVDAALSTHPTPEAEPMQQDTPVAEVVMAVKPPKASPAWLPYKIVHASLAWLDSVPVGTKLYTTPSAEKQAAPSGEDWPVPYGKLLTMLRWARRYVADERLHESELDGRKRHETIQEHEDRISSAIQANEDTRTFLQEIDEALALIDATPAPQDTKGADHA